MKAGTRERRRAGQPHKHHPSPAHKTATRRLLHSYLASFLQKSQ